MVGQASARVPQLPHAERVAEERVSAPNNHPEFRQGEGERTRHNCNKKNIRRKKNVPHFKRKIRNSENVMSNFKASYLSMTFVGFFVMLEVNVQQYVLVSFKAHLATCEHVCF